MFLIIILSCNIVYNSPGLRDAVGRLFEGETVKVVTTNKKKDGSRFKCFLTMGPLHDENGKLTHFVAILKDIGKA